MFWDDKKDSEDMQRLKNLVFLKMPVKNATRDEAFDSPIIIGIILVIIIVVTLLVAFSSK